MKHRTYSMGLAAGAWLWTAGAIVGAQAPGDEAEPPRPGVVEVKVEPTPRPVQEPPGKEGAQGTDGIGGTNLVAGVATNIAALVEPQMTAEEARREFLQIQGRLDSALLAMERNRRESEAVVQRTKEEVSTRLRSIERTLQDQRDRELEAVRQSNQTMLIVAGLIAGIGFLAMLITSVFHMRAMNRLAGIAAALPMGGAFIPGAAEALGEMEEKLVTMAPGGNPGTRLLSAIERLEKRVFELEHTSHTAEVGAGSSGSQGGGRVLEAELAAGEGQEAASQASGEPSASSGGQDQVSMLLGKAQALLSLGQAEEAVACFDAVLRLEPHHAEALVKKGTALEKLKRLDEAIECYDRAIHANQSMTLAYLYKGGLFNRMERYDEALACYEQALKTQGKGAS